MKPRNQFALVAAKRKQRSLVLLIALVCCCIVPASATRRERLIDSWKPVNYDIAITLNDQLTEITSARAAITVVALKTVALIDFDFGALAVDAVTVNKKAVTYSRAPGRLYVKLSEPLTKDERAVVTVSYHGAPKDGLILALDAAGKRSAVGDNWPNRVHHWIPCLDHPAAKATVNFTVTAPARAIVVANGKLERVGDATPGNRTWNFTEAAPIPPYCMVIAVGEFVKTGPAIATSTPLNYYVSGAEAALAVQAFLAAPPSLKFFSETIAPYPYEKLALIVGATRFGGMENSSAIVFPLRFLSLTNAEPLSQVFRVRKGAVETVAHEIAHQWFGDSVTESTWADLWLSEGFATYFAGLFVGQHEGEARFSDYMEEQAAQYFSFQKSQNIPLHDNETEDLFKLLNANNYQKGAWVLHMLRAELGDEKFFQGVRAYYAGHQGAVADSEDLRQALEKASGQSLKDFFGRWVYGKGHPRYALTWSWNQKMRKLKIVLDQLQTEAAFPNAVPVELMLRGESRRIIFRPESKHSVMNLRLGESPRSVILDPDNVILDESHVSKSKGP